MEQRRQRRSQLLAYLMAIRAHWESTLVKFPDLPAWRVREIECIINAIASEIVKLSPQDETQV